MSNVAPTPAVEPLLAFLAAWPGLPADLESREALRVVSDEVFTAGRLARKLLEQLNHVISVSGREVHEIAGRISDPDVRRQAELTAERIGNWQFYAAERAGLIDRVFDWL